MKISGINQSRCIQCENCLGDCPSNLFAFQNENKKKIIVFTDPLAGCIHCGHCVAICPTNAIECEDSGPFIEISTDSTHIPDYSQLLLLLRKKRSTRQFTNDKIAKEQIELILNAIRFSPSASNARKWEFLIITDPLRIRDLSKEVVRTIKLTRSLIKNPIIKNLFLYGETRKQVKQPGFLPSLNNIIEISEDGGDPIFFNAPCIIILHSPKYGNLTSVDCGIALTYGMLAAETKGLGSCWIGIAQEAMQRLPSLRKKFGLKHAQIPWGCIIVGNPSIQYKHLPPRDPLKVTWK